MKKQIITLGAALLVGFTSCKKEDETKTPVVKEKTKTELLVQDVWDLEKIKVTSRAGGQIIFNQEYPMEGTIEFKSDHTGISNVVGEGTETFEWGLNGDTLTIDGEAAFIANLTENRLELMNSFSEEDSTLGEITVEMVISLNR